jgi:hypothetical protein
VLDLVVRVLEESKEKKDRALNRLIEANASESGPPEEGHIKKLMANKKKYDELVRKLMQIRNVMQVSRSVFASVCVCVCVCL